jgi:putative tryptophan/tyrosine transport system substrate-binding protein
MRRRVFIAGLGGAAAAWPLAARAQQRSMPLIGYLDGGSLDTSRETAAWVRRGLSEAGYVEGRNMAIEYRWAEDHYDRLPGLADDLVRRQVAVLVASTTPAALAAKAATESIPIVFYVGTDPIDLGLVPRFNQPGGNVTGVSVLIRATSAKRLELLHELLPAALSIGYLVNPTNPFFAEPETRDLQAAARILGVRLLILNASDQGEFDAAFATLVRERAGGLVVSSDPLFFNRSDQLVALAARHRMPVIYTRRAAAAGGLMSYGTDFPDVWLQTGIYADRILKGEKPADLPVQQVTKVQRVINMKIAKALGITIPETLLATADEVIE